jgi:SAM-dependent methyltransferase
MTSTSGAIDPEEGRTLFGIDPANYDAARPDYPDEVYDLLRNRCGLGPGTRVIEIGPGTGLATKHLAQAGASIVVVEPDAALGAFLADAMGPFGNAVDIRTAAFEDVELADASFDLAVAATSFHWVDQARGLAKVARILRPGGWWAGWWNVFGDPSRPDAFHDATQPWLRNLAGSPASGRNDLPFALDVAARREDLEVAGFKQVECERMAWTLTLTSAEVRRLYATYSLIIRLLPSARAEVLDAIARVAGEQFGGRVDRNMTTVLYTARRPRAASEQT